MFDFRLSDHNYSMKKAASSFPIKHLLFGGLIIMVGINVLLGLPKAVGLVETKVLPQNVAKEKPQNVAGVSKSNIPQSRGIKAPELSAAAVIAQDTETGFVFFAKDPNKRVPIASTTKIMTALVAAEHYQGGQILTVPNDLPGGSSMGLKVGEQLSFRSLLYGLLLNSGNDAAYSLAVNYLGGFEGFVLAMNEKAKELGLINTHFDNPAGFDGPNHFSSASDLAKIAIEAYKNYQIARVVATKNTTVSSTDKAVIHSLHNLNRLLDIPGVVGFKTGYTAVAKENLVTLMEKDDTKILTVVLGSDDRFGETKTLLDWINGSFTW